MVLFANIQYILLMLAIDHMLALHLLVLHVLALHLLVLQVLAIHVTNVMTHNCKVRLSLGFCYHCLTYSCSVRFVNVVFWVVNALL